MVFISCFFVLFVLNLTKTLDLKSLPEDLTEILEKVIDEVEARRNNKASLIETISNNDSQIIYLKEELNPRSDLEPKTTNLSEENDEYENKSSPSSDTLEQNIDYLENDKIDKMPSLESILTTDSSSIGQQINEDTQNPMFIHSRRKAQNEDQEAVNYLISNENKNDEVEKTRKNFNNLPETLTSSNGDSSGIKELNENLEKMLKVIEAIKNSRKVEKSVTNKHMKYKIIPHHNYDVTTKKPFLEVHSIVPQRPIMKSAPITYRQIYGPQQNIIKSPATARRRLVQNYHIPQSQKHTGLAVPQVHRVFVHEIPLLVNNIPKFVWSIL